MEWRDEAIVLGVRRHGEGSVIVETMTRYHGRHLGVVRGGRGPRMSAILQPGNRVDLVWRARLEEHLGYFAVEALELAAGRLIGSALALYGLTTLGFVLRLLSEREAHEGLYHALCQMIAALDNPVLAGPLVVRFELALLQELGFGLDLSECAATGATTDLIYVSPKSGKAVSRVAGAPYHDRLLALPPFLKGDFAQHPTKADLQAAFALSEHFLRRDVLGPRQVEMPDQRQSFIAAVLAAMTE